MIDDRFPELKELAPEEKMELASELVLSVQDLEGISELSQKSVEILEDELAEVIKDPKKGLRQDTKTIERIIKNRLPK